MQYNTIMILYRYLPILWLAVLPDIARKQMIVKYGARAFGFMCVIASRVNRLRQFLGLRRPPNKNNTDF